MSNPDSYEELIAVLCAKELPTLEIALLTDALGCSQPRFTGGDWYLHAPTQPLETHEYLILVTLRQCLYWYVRKDRLDRESGFAILEGLARNDRWLFCTENTRDALDLSVLLVHMVIFFSAEDSTQYGTIFKDAAASLIRTVIDGWLPGTKFRKDGFPLPFLLMRSLFGDAWCAMALEGYDVPKCKELFDLIQLTQPVFMPGLIKDNAIDAPPELPALDS